MAGGEPFTHAQQVRLERALAAASSSTGLRFLLRVGPLEERTRAHAERLLTWSLPEPAHDSAVLIAVSPAQRVVEIVSSAPARRRVTDDACGLALLTMTTSFGVGDLVGGLVNGVQMLADAAGRALPAPAASA